MSAALLLLFAFAVDHPTGSRTTPPVIQSVSPRGIARGAAAELTIEGLNLGGATAIYFSEPGLKGRIVSVKELPDVPEPVRLGSGGLPDTVDLGPLPPRNQVTVEVEANPDADIGPVRFRLLTPLGTTAEGRFLVEPYYGEAPDKEPNDNPEQAFETYLPAVLVGTIARPGDLDYYKINVKDGEQVVFDNGAAALGSSLQPVVSILAPDQSVVAQGGEERRPFSHRFEKGGTYYIRVGDYQEGGSANHFYRILVGQFPVAWSAYPLGLQRGKVAEIALQGAFLAPGKLQLKGEPSPDSENTLRLRPPARRGRAFNELRLALGDEPEVESSGTEAAQAVTPPVTVNGRVAAGKQNDFRFHAKKDEAFAIEVNADRLGSPLDSLVEVLDAQGKPIERATVRCVWETTTTLSERDSVGRGIRLTSWNDLHPGDYVMIGGEIIRVEEMPRTPDEDVVFEAFNGQRLAYFDTSTEAHAMDKPVYKVQVHPPGAKFASNGLPLVRLTYRNDDGGPGYGKDSRLHFTAPADGDYLVRIRDTRGLGGDDYAYRLTLRHPKPDFELSVNPRNVNVAAGSRVPVTVTALRKDDFDGPIEVAVEDLPPGVQATRSVIAPRQVSTTLLVSAAPDARLQGAVPLKIAGRARIGERLIAHQANPDDRLKLLSLTGKPDVVITAEKREVTVAPGGRAAITVRIRRQNGFGGRVPVEVRNLPPGVHLPDIGLNGILINEQEEQRTFQIEALPTAQPIEQTLIVAARVETRSPLQNSFAAEPIVLKLAKR